ncbi:MAG TPA: hypothetical protein VFI61_00965 [Patescibacteria group bacterium]|nr:hypothetical protein [Patescibacteria group bacterium]
MMDTEFEKTKLKVKEELANFLGVETDDIEDDTTLTEGLHMKASDLTDFLEILNRMGMDTTNVDLTETESFLELIEALTTHE